MAFLGIAALVGAAAGGITYLSVKKKRAAASKDNTPVVAAGAAGAATTAATWAGLTFVSAFWPLLLIVGVPLGVGYVVGKAKGQQKALPPGS